MTLGLLLAVGAFGAALSGWALGREGPLARAGALGGVLALVLIAVLAALSPTPESLTPDAAGAVAGTLWNGALVPGGYLRLVIVLWSGSSVVLALIAWLLRGVDGLRGLLPATLAAIVGATVSLGASSLGLGAVAAAAAGLASIPAVLASPRGSAAGIAAREVRIAVATGLVVLAVVAVVPVLARLILANPEGPVTAAGSGETATIAFGLLAMALAVAARIGAIPWHVRVSALTDTVPAGALPLVIAWLPLPLAVVAVGVTSGVVAPLMPQIGAARGLIVALTLLCTLAAALVAFLQDDLRHAVGYLTIADLGIVVLAMAALDPAVWGPARTWVLTAAVTKTALAAWAAVAEDRYGTRSIPELRGWLRPSPLLGLALLLIVVATFCLPGSAVWDARVELVRHAADGPLYWLLLIASWLPLAAYLRWVWIGFGAPTSHVDGAVPEIAGLGALPARRLSAAPPAKTLPIEQEGEPSTPRGARRTEPTTDRDVQADAAETGPLPRRRARQSSGAGAATGASEMIKRHRASLLSGALLALALLATLVASGGFDVARAACEPTPAVPGLALACK